jgi:uncharacterized coiled-coil protein SlyX
VTQDQADGATTVLKTFGPWAAGAIAAGSMIWSLSNSISTITTTLNFQTQEIAELQKSNTDQISGMQQISEQLAQVEQQLADIKAAQDKGEGK